MQIDSVQNWGQWQQQGNVGGAQQPQVDGAPDGDGAQGVQRRRHAHHQADGDGGARPEKSGKSQAIAQLSALIAQFQSGADGSVDLSPDQVAQLSQLVQQLQGNQGQGQDQKAEGTKRHHGHHGGGGGGDDDWLKQLEEQNAAAVSGQGPSAVV